MKRMQLLFPDQMVTRLNEASALAESIIMESEYAS